MNSFFCSTLLDYKNPRVLSELCGHPIPHYVRSAGLSTISFLYQYVNTPPLAFGSPGPKIAESVLRSVEYNRLPNNGFGEGHPRQFWLNSDGPFPFDKVSSNFHLASFKAMVSAFVLEHHALLDQVASSTYGFLGNQNADVLTKGRQTWDPVNMRSVPSPSAFLVMEKIFRENLPDMGYSCLSFLKAFDRMLGLPQFTYSRKVSETQTYMMFNKTTKARETFSKLVVRVRTFTASGPDVADTLMDWATRLCAYQKGSERGKLRRRAICSANIILRMFLFCTEEFHLRLGENLPGSTISIGGDKKKNKILATIAAVTKLPLAQCLQATEDATKWNECLSPEEFALMAVLLFSDEIRDQHLLPRAPLAAKRLSDVMLTCAYLLSKKSVYMGQGHICQNATQESRFEWKEEDIPKMNTNTASWFIKCLPFMDGPYLKAPYGMLMGMLNAASTTIGLIPQHFRMAHYETEGSVRSSDDSMTLACCTEGSIEYTFNKINNNRRLVGINPSTKKNRYFRLHYGEFTSWYQDDGEFLSQYGVETSSLRPSGMNPPDDFHNIAVNTSVALREGKMNFVGAQMRLCLGVSNVRRLWRIEHNSRKRELEGVSSEVLLLADGGNSPWTAMNSHLQEIAMKERVAIQQTDKNYLLKVMNPDNPFSTGPVETTTYSVEIGSIIDKEVEVPRNIFHYSRKSNSTIKGVTRKEDIQFSKACALAKEVYEHASPHSSISNPTGGRKMALSVAELMRMSVNSLRSVGEAFTAEENEELAQALRVLDEPPVLEVEGGGMPSDEWY